MVAKGGEVFYPPSSLAPFDFACMRACIARDGWRGNANPSPPSPAWVEKRRKDNLNINPPRARFIFLPFLFPDFFFSSFFVYLLLSSTVASALLILETEHIHLDF